jgi:hypothetical protein
MTLEIDKEFQQLIPPLASDELAQLQSKMTEIDITPREIETIRNLSESKLIHFLSVVSDKGWELARILLPAMSA